MFKKILLPFDGLRTTTNISGIYSIQFSKIFNAKLYVLHIITDDALKSTKECIKKSNSYVKDYCIRRTHILFEEFKAKAKELGFSNYELKVIFADKVGRGVHKFVKDNGIDLCIMEPSPYHQSGLVEDLALKIARKVKIPSIFVKTKEVPKTNSKILVPIDEKEGNLVSVRFAVEVIKVMGGKMLFYHTTWRNPQLKTEKAIKHCDAKSFACINEAARIAKENNIPYEIVVEMAETIEEGIIRCAVRNSVEMIVMSKSESFVGGQPELVLKNSMYDLLLVKKQ